MNKLNFLSLLMLAVLVNFSINAQESQPNVAITLERGPCFGACPIYTITILEDGTVIYEGQRFVEVIGEQRTEIDPETVALMVESFENAGYFDWDEAYDTRTITDLPTVITSVTRNDETHRILRYTGDSTAPLALPYLEMWIDVMVNSQLWTGAEPDIYTVSIDSDAPLITLQREPCFGFCPVYNLTLFEDGMIVYMSIANVDEIGVRVFETDAFAITSIAQMASSVGYFDWQDSYEVQVMTDQATVITSIRWGGQFKRIVRYDGDPNAPIGLIWIEESIDQLITDLAG